MSKSRSALETELPPTRVRKIIKEAQDNQPEKDSKYASQVSAEAAVLITKATELFIADIADGAGRICIRENHQALALSDVVEWVHNATNDTRYPYIREVIPKKVPLAYVASRQRALAEQQQQIRELIAQQQDEDDQ